MENTPQPGKARPSWLIPLIVGAVALFVGVGIGMADGGGKQPVAAASSPSPSDEGMTLAPPEPSPSPEPTYGTLTAKDLEVKLKTIESSCYGSAGGLMTVRLNVGIDGTVADSLDPAVQWDVTYRVLGDENGPIVGTFSIYPDGQYDVNEENLSTPTCATQPTVKIIDIESF